MMQFLIKFVWIRFGLWPHSPRTVLNISARGERSEAKSNPYERLLLLGLFCLLPLHAGINQPISTPLVVTKAEYGTPISQAQVANGTTFVISKPGYYLLAGDLTFRPTVANKNVIEIQSDDVTLDLNTLSIQSDNIQAGINAIVVDNDLSNIVIKNGSIFFITGTGIVAGSGCKNITIIGIYTHDCDGGGISMEGTIASSISSCNITRSNGTATGSAAVGLTLDSCNDIEIINSAFNASNSLTIPAKGAFLDTCINCRFTNCQAVTNVGTSGYGFHLVDSTACIFNDCTAISNRGLTSDGFGFALETGANMQFERCKALSNNSLATNAYGFYFSETKYTAINCSTSSNQGASASSGDAFGFFSRAGTGNKFFQCIAVGNTGGTSSSSIGAGFSLNEGETGSSIETCTSTNNNGNRGEGYGVKLGGTANGDTTTRCIVQSNTLSINTGTERQYGYKDFAANSTTFLAKNLAFDQGKVKTTPTITDHLKMNYYFTYTSPARNPYEIIYETDIAALRTIDTASPFINLSIFGPK